MVSEHFQLLHVCQECWSPWGLKQRRIRGSQQCPNGSQHMGHYYEKGMVVCFFKCLT